MINKIKTALNVFSLLVAIVLYASIFIPSIIVTIAEYVNPVHIVTAQLDYVNYLTIFLALAAVISPLIHPLYENPLARYKDYLKYFSLAIWLCIALVSFQIVLLLISNDLELPLFEVDGQLFIIVILAANFNLIPSLRGFGIIK